MDWASSVLLQGTVSQTYDSHSAKGISFSKLSFGESFFVFKVRISTLLGVISIKIIVSRDYRMLPQSHGFVSWH